MIDIKRVLFKEWSFMRWLRLAIGVYAAVQAILLHDTLLGFLASFFLFQAITNTGCFGNISCSTRLSDSPIQEKDEIVYKEIKSEKNGNN